MLQEAGDPPGSALVILHSVLEAAVSLALLAANLSTLDASFFTFIILSLPALWIPQRSFARAL